MSRAIDKLGFYQEPPAERGETVLAAEFASDMALKQDWMGPSPTPVAAESEQALLVNGDRQWRRKSRSPRHKEALCAT